MTGAFVAPEADLARTPDYFISQSDIGRTVKRPVLGSPVHGAPDSYGPPSVFLSSDKED
jgi:hypothetical protein